MRLLLFFGICFVAGYITFVFWVVYREPIVLFVTGFTLGAIITLIIYEVENG